jgi:hypothetical protein
MAPAIKGSNHWMMEHGCPMCLESMPYFKNGGVRFYHQGVIWIPLLEPMNVRHDERIALRALCPDCSKRLPACMLCQHWNGNPFAIGSLLDQQAQCRKKSPPWESRPRGIECCGEFSIKPITFTHEELRVLHETGHEAITPNWFEPKRTTNAQASTQEQQRTARDREDAAEHQ